MTALLRGLASEASPEPESPLARRMLALALSLRDRLTMAIAPVDQVIAPPERVAQVIAPHDPLLATRFLLEAEGWDIERLVDRVCAILEVDAAELRQGRRPGAVPSARAVIGLLGSRYLGRSVRSIARATGVSAPGMSKAISRAPRVLDDLELAPEDVFGKLDLLGS